MLCDFHNVTVNRLSERIKLNLRVESVSLEPGFDEFSVNLILGSLSTRVFETRTATGREHLAYQESIVSQIFVLLISNEKR